LEEIGYHHLIANYRQHQHHSSHAMNGGFNEMLVGSEKAYTLAWSQHCQEPNAISIFITADIESRIENVSKRMGIDKNAARKFIEDKEDERSKYYNYYTGKKWGHASSYDLCVDSSILGIEQTAEFIANFIKAAK
jgi:cytidylate kinase